MEKEKRDDTATLTAKACECSAAYVRLVVNGDRNNVSPKAAKIISTYNAILEAKNNLSKPVESTFESTN